MKKHLLALCLLPVLGLSSVPASFAASPSINPQNISTAPSIPADKLQRLPWTPLMPPVSQDVVLGASSPGLNIGELTGSVAAFVLPADQGSLDITLTSLVKDLSVYAPNVLILDGQMQPAAFFPSSYFQYQKPGVTSGDRLENVIKLTPMMGQKQIYMLIYTTRHDLTETTRMINPAKLYAEGAGNAIPDVADPVARHSGQGTLTVKLKTEQKSGNIMIGKIFGGSDAKPVVVGHVAPAAAYSAPAAVPASAVAPAPAAKSEPMLNDTDSYFNHAIKQAVDKGDIDKALKLLNEAERLGSTSARKTFISSVKGKG